MMELIHPTVKFLFAFITPLIVVSATLLWFMPTDHKKTNRFLAVTLLIGAIDGAYYIFYFSNAEFALKHPEFYGFQSLALYLVIPGFYIYVRKILLSIQETTIRIWPHYILFAVILLGLTPLLFAPSTTKQYLLTAIFVGKPIDFALLHLPSYSLIFLSVSQTAFIFLIVFYIVKIFRTYQYHQAHIQQLSSDLAQAKTRWVLSILAALFAYLILMLLSMLIGSLSEVYFSKTALNVFVAGNALLYGFVAFQALLHPYLYTKELQANLAQFKEESKKEKYHHSHMSDAEATAIKDELVAHLTANQPYLKESLTLKELAEQLDIHRMQTLSEVISRKLNTNFYQLINQYRIKEAIRMMESNEPIKSITDLAFSVGFNSISTFNRQFKQKTGQSPLAYLCKRQGK